MNKWNVVGGVVATVILIVGIWNIAYSEIPYTDVNGNAQSSSRVVMRCVKGTAGMLPQGTVVCITGWDSTYSCATVEAADADNLTLGPGVGIITGNIGTTTVGDCVTNGLVVRLNTNSFTAGDTLYLSTASTGTLTATAPTGLTARVQVICKVISKDTKNGVVLVTAGTPATVPNAVIATTGMFGGNTTMDIGSDGSVSYSNGSYTRTAAGNIDTDGYVHWDGTGSSGGQFTFNNPTTIFKLPDGGTGKFVLMSTTGGWNFSGVRN